MNYVIVGAGIAGTTAAESLRKIDETANITLIGEEQHSLYSRVLLPLYAAGKVPREKVFMKKDEWYMDKNIEYLRGESVVKIDTKNKSVELTGARELPYDKLLIATGGDARSMGFQFKNVSYLQTLDDADHLVSLLAQYEGNDQARGLIYGGGFIACEYLNIFAAKKIPTTVVYRGKHFWSKVFTPELGVRLKSHLEEKGVTVIDETLIDSVDENDGRLICKTTGEELTGDILGVGVGLERDLGLIRDAQIDHNLGVITNEFLETSAPDVYAIGDICEFKDVITGHELIAGNFMNAQMQARAVAKNMTGEREDFRLVSSYTMSVLGLDLTFVGDIRKELADEIVIRSKDGYFAQILISGGKIVGGVMVGGNTDRMPITKLIQNQVDVSEKLEELKNPGFELKGLLE